MNRTLLARVGQAGICVLALLSVAPARASDEAAQATVAASGDTEQKGGGELSKSSARRLALRMWKGESEGYGFCSVASLRRLRRDGAPFRQPGRWSVIRVDRRDEIVITSPCKWGRAPLGADVLVFKATGMRRTTRPRHGKLGICSRARTVRFRLYSSTFGRGRNKPTARCERHANVSCARFNGHTP